MLLIVDGNNLAHRCKHVFDLSHKGLDISITYGFLRVMASLMEKFSPSSIMVCWDGGIPNFRRRAVPEYKANRAKGDESEYLNFIRQVRELDKVALPMMGIISIRKRGAEADDLMYHASRIYDGTSVIVTTDQDLLQAICAGVSVYSPTKEKLYTQREVELEFGVMPTQIVHWRALCGDGSDNIPGIKGIGPKTATKLFTQFGSLVGIVNAALGVNPLVALEDGALKDRIATFGLERLGKSVAVMALYADRVGAKRAILEAVYCFRQADKVEVKNYLLGNAFVSLLETPKFLGGIIRLREPKLFVDKTRFPVTFATERKSAI